MKVRNLKIPIYDVDLKLVQVEDPSDSVKIKSMLSRLHCIKEDINETVSNIENDRVDGGDTFYNMSIFKIVVIFYKMKSFEKMIEVYMHEKRHVEDRILEHFEISCNESWALLAGYLGVEFLKFMKQSE